MLITTRAIVLRAVRHGDRSVVLKLYTEHHGLRGYLVRMGGKSGIAPALLQPLQRLAVVAHERGDRELHYLKEARPDRPFVNVGSDPIRGSLVLFLQEVLLRTLREETNDPALFAYLYAALDLVDDAPDPGHFPLTILAGLSHHFGFAPEQPEGQAKWFDLQNGVFTDHEPAHPHAFGGALVPVFARLFQQRSAPAPALRLAPAVRKELLGKMLHYYRLHVAGFGELRSPAVLQAVMG